MAKKKEEDPWTNLLDGFLVTMLLEPHSKTEIVRSAKDIVAEVNRAKRAKRMLKKAKEEYFGGSKGNMYIKGFDVWITFIDHLENNIPLSKEVEREVKFSFDYTKLSKRQKLWIRWQATAQMIALESPRKRISEISKEILKDYRLDRLLGFDTLPSLGNPKKNLEDRFREIENAIGEVVKWRVGRPSKDAQSTILISPLVFSNGRINFQALHTVMIAVGSALKIWGRPLPKNFVLPIVDMYKKALPVSNIIDVFIHIGIYTYYHDRGKGEYYD